MKHVHTQWHRILHCTFYFNTFFFFKFPPIIWLFSIDFFFSFSLTLIDALDTLVMLGDLEEFEHAVRLVIKDVSFDNDIVVSVFETNIRVLG